MDVERFEIRPGLILKHPIRVQSRSGTCINIPADGNRRIASFETQVGSFLMAAHLINRMAAKDGDIRFVPGLPGQDLSLIASCHCFAEFIQHTKVPREPAGWMLTIQLLIDSPAGRVVKNL
jgi:hypothetical protein